MQIDVEPEELQVHWARKYAAEIGVGFLALAVIVIGLAIWSAARHANPKQEHPVTTLWTGFVDVSKPWQDIGISVKSGTTLVINAYSQGCVRWASDVTDARGVCIGPSGAPWTPLDLFNTQHSQSQLDAFPLPNANCGALIFRIRNHVYPVAANSTMIKVDEDGEIQFAANINQHYLSAASGQFHLELKVWK